MSDIADAKDIIANAKWIEPESMSVFTNAKTIDGCAKWIEPAAMSDNADA